MKGVKCWDESEKEPNGCKMLTFFRKTSVRVAWEHLGAPFQPAESERWPLHTCLKLATTRRWNLKTPKALPFTMRDAIKLRGVYVFLMRELNCLLALWFQCKWKPCGLWMSSRRLNALQHALCWNIRIHTDSLVTRNGAALCWNDWKCNESKAQFGSFTTLSLQENVKVRAEMLHTRNINQQSVYLEFYI